MNTVEQWLAQGNRPKVFPMGYTAYPDGNIPYSKANNEEVQKKKEEKLKLLQEEKEAAKKAREAERAILAITAKERKAERAKQLREEKKAKREAEKLAYERIASMHVIQKSEPKVRIRGKKKSVATERFHANKASKIAAIASGAAEYKAECKKHGMTVFTFRKDGYARCYECTSGRNRMYYRPKRLQEVNDNSDRVSANKIKKNEAHAKGLKTFMADCINCGETEFTIKMSKGYVSCRCITCRKNTQKAMNTNRKERYRNELKK